MKAIKFINHVFLTLFLTAIPFFLAAQTGTVRGVITDESTGETVIGANIVIQGTTRGTASDLNGEFILIGLRPGNYNLEFSAIGFGKIIIEDVSVKIDLSTTINVKMREQIIEGQEVTIVAQRELVQKDVTATLSSVDRKQIEALPVENLGEVVGLQAGVVNGHFRGGRSGEVGYWVDGIPVTDVYNGGSSSNVENSSVQEVQVVTGAFNAEYGQAMSGIVNIVTRDGSNKFSGSIGSFTGDYLSKRTNLFQNIDTIDPISVKNLEANFEGPIIKDRLFFFVSGRYFSNEGYLYGRDVFRSGDIGLDANNRIVLQDSTGSGDSTYKAMNPYEKFSYQAKLTWRVIPNVRVMVNAIWGNENFKNYRHNARYMPSLQLNENSGSQIIYAKLTHTVGDRTFYDLSASVNLSTYENYLYKDPMDSRYLLNDFSGFSVSPLYSNFTIGGSDNSRFDRSTTTSLAKFDLTSQFNNSNQVKMGVEYRQHELKLNSESVIISSSGADPRLFSNASYTEKPIEISGYIQDKIEIGTLIINVGVRGDYFDSKGRVFSDERNRNIVFEELREDFSGDIFSKADPKWQLSPRLGIAFPISAGGVIHFSYGHFFQIPNFELLYQNPYFRLSQGGSGLIGIIGNSNLEPQKTINGEIGLKQEVTETSAIEITAYFRDIRNLAGSGADPIPVQGTSARYAKLQNSDFGFVKGLVLSYNQIIGTGFSFGADYTFQVAKGNASDPAQIYNAAAAKQQLEKQIVSLDWDQLHTINVNSSYTGKSFGGGLIFTWGSGFPYTPVLSTVQAGSIVPSTIPLNSERKPVTWNVNLDMYKNFTIVGTAAIQLYAKVNNLFDTGNENGVYGDTGRATYSLQKNIDARTFRGDTAFLDAWYSRPDFYNEPRRVVLGLRFSF